MPRVKTANPIPMIPPAPNPQPQLTLRIHQNSQFNQSNPKGTKMASKPKPNPFSLLIITIITITITAVIASSPPSVAASPSRWAPPRFPGKFSRGSRGGTLRYETRFVEQRVDHFSFSESERTRTFRQRYLVSAEHWGGPAGLGPIFVYCGNEGDIEWFARNTGFVWEIAPQFSAMVLFPEVFTQKRKKDFV